MKTENPQIKYALSRLKQNVWLMESVVGSVWHIFINERQKVKNELREVYWFDDIDDVFPDEVDRDYLKLLFDQIFKVSEISNAQTSPTFLSALFPKK